MRHLRVLHFFAGFVPIVALLALPRPAAAQRYYAQANLVSDIPGLAAHTHSPLVNPWGITFGGTGPFWVSDNKTGVSTLYNGAGVPQSLVVTLPTPPGTTTPASPTGIVANTTTGFVVRANGKSGAANFIFATEDGTISAWNFSVDLTHAILEVNRSATAVYKGLAIAQTPQGPRLFAANFKEGRIDIFDSNFQFVDSFTDTRIPAGFAPFNVQNVGSLIVVTFAKQDADKQDDVRGVGNGFVDLFNPNTNALTPFAARGTLNSPWGAALSPANFGRFSNALLIGNFGDGKINAFNPTTGRFLGQLTSPNGQPVQIQGLWALLFGNGGSGGARNILFFTAGIEDEAHGLLGGLVPTNVSTSRRPGLF